MPGSGRARRRPTGRRRRRGRRWAACAATKRPHGLHARDPVDAERAPVRAGRVPRDQVPAAARVDERRAARPRGGSASPRPLRYANRRRSWSRHADAVAASTAPSTCGPAPGYGTVAEPTAATRRRSCRRQHLLELGERADRRLLDPRHAGAGRGPQADGHRHRLALVEQQRRQRGARREPVAARDPAARLDRVAERAQALDVAADRARADPEPLGELRRPPSRAAPAAARAARAAWRRSRPRPHHLRYGPK